jgi:hypothetical protein
MAKSKSSTVFTAVTDKTDSKQAPWQFKPGQSGNPLGRPKGSRSKLSESFIAAMCSDFEENGVRVIETVRAERPQDYLKIIASILPKELHVKDASLDDMSDGELVELLAAVRSLVATDDGEKASGQGKRKAAEKTAAGKLN